MASSSRVGMEKLFKGILNYRQTWKESMVQQFKKVRDNPTPTAVFFTCIDSRVHPTTFTSTNVGDMFIIRNAGNFIPHSKTLKASEKVSTEAAALELGCVMNAVQHVVVCGHSDCKAVNLLHTMRNNFDESGQLLLPDTEPDHVKSPMRQWLREHGVRSLLEYKELKKNNFLRPMMLQVDGNAKKIPAYIDKDCNFNETDKLSQINTLVQLENIASYPFIASCLRSETAKIHAFWFDIYTGEIYYFSRRRKYFEPIGEDNVVEFLDELGDASGESPGVKQVLNTVGKALDDATDCKH